MVTIKQEHCKCHYFLHHSNSYVVTVDLFYMQTDYCRKYPSRRHVYLEEEHKAKALDRNLST
jgi:hypothetical protein